MPVLSSSMAVIGAFAVDIDSLIEEIDIDVDWVNSLSDFEYDCSSCDPESD